MSKTGNGNVVIHVEQHNEKEIQDAVKGIRNIAREAWFAALASRGLQRIRLSELEFDQWWKEKLDKSKTTID